VFHTRLIKIAVIILYSLYRFVLGIIFEEKKSKSRVPVRNFLVLVFRYTKYVSVS
jgi:hypothetical protein